MLSILVVLPTGGEAEEPPAGRPSVEILLAHGAEDAVEKLGRNRRIDAVLLAAGEENTEIAQAIRSDNPAPPPLFAAGISPPTGVRSLPGGAILELIDLLAGQLEGRP